MLYWQRQGTGPEVVLVHGFLGSSKIFEPLAVHLVRRFSVTTIDLPGFAGSYDIPVPSTVEELSQMVVETIRSAGLDKCSILGHSLGAWIALEISLQQPDLLEKMVLYGGSPDGHCPERFEAYEESIERIRSEGVESFAIELAAEWFRRGKQDPMYPLAIEAGSQSNEAAAIDHVKSWNQWKTRDRLAEVTTPSLIVCGDSDRSTHPDLSIEMWKKIPQSQLFIAPNAGHIVHLEHTQEFNAIVAKFLQ
jgi:3-oxoadipate enol-lactonase